jgi:hypothetical protein
VHRSGFSLGFREQGIWLPDLDDSSDGECSDGECSEEGASEGECSESSSQDGDESELGEVAEVTGDLSEFASMSAAQEVKEEAIETQTEHIRKHGQNHQCPRCRFMRHREEIFKTCTYQCPSGSIGTWVEEVCRPGHPWGLGCKLCRWAGVNSIWSRGCVRSDRGTQLTSLMRHGNHRREKSQKGKTNDICRAHEESQQKLLDSEKPSDERGGVSPADDLLSDVPTLAQFFYSIQDRQDRSLFLLLRERYRSRKGMWSTHTHQPIKPCYGQEHRASMQ